MTTQAPTAVRSISLAEAVLCVGCETVSDAKNDHCPVCGGSGEGLLSLAQVLGERPPLPEGRLFRLRGTG